jgi:hypothetical protein
MFVVRQAVLSILLNLELLFDTFVTNTVLKALEGFPGLPAP